jgi:acyl-CoA synthetase (AMP-forming)/AMP-acid ligase II
MPLYHTNALNNQLILPLLTGARIALHRRFVPEDFLDWLVAERPTYVTGSPTMYRRLLGLPVPSGATSSLRFVRGGAAPFSEDFQTDVERHLGVPLLVSWGLTEATCTSAMNPPGAQRKGTVGPPLPGQEVALLDFDEDVVLGPGARGEIGIRGPNVAPQFGPGWLRTGDIGTFDQDGYLSIVGRRKELILRGGENVFPGEVESVLLTHDGIAQCCVVGVPSQDYGEAPVACVVRDGAGSAPDSEIRAQLLSLAARKLSRYAIPEQILLLDELPTIGVGKVDRRTIRGLAVEYLAGMETREPERKM